MFSNKENIPHNQNRPFELNEVVQFLVGSIQDLSEQVKKLNNATDVLQEQNKNHYDLIVKLNDANAESSKTIDGKIGLLSKAIKTSKKISKEIPNDFVPQSTDELKAFLKQKVESVDGWESLIRDHAKILYQNQWLTLFIM